MTSALPVLGLFKDEGALRDHVAANLQDLEPGLVKTTTEYELENPIGAGGRVDILALDEFDHVVVIELKRSDSSARSTLNELAKYVSLLVRDARVPREAIRCMVLSTDWHELRLPLSFFAATAGVHVEGIEVFVEDGNVAFRPVELTPISNLPQFSPEFSIYQYMTSDDREEHLAGMRSRIERLPFVRLAVIKLDAPAGSANTPFRSIACLWRIPAGYEDEIHRVTGNPVGYLVPYAFPGWEAECDVLYWIADEERPGVMDVSADEERGTAEKSRNLLMQYAFVGVERYGDWPKVDLINTEARILRQIEATSSLVSADRKNRYEFLDVVSPRFRPSWDHAIRMFLDFISFEPIWRNEAEIYLAGIKEKRARVTLYALDKNHFFYLLHQGRSHPKAQMSHFVIAVSIDGEDVGGLSGHWVWDGETHPHDAEDAIIRTFGSLGWAQVSCFSAVDQQRYEQAVYEHGFQPVVYRMISNGEGQYPIQPIYGELREGGSLQDFIHANGEYVNAVSEIFAQIPTAPGEAGQC